MADKIQPTLKKAKLELRQNRRHHFEGVQKQLCRYKSLICQALDQLNSDWTYFCLVKILNCNADESCSFSGAYCKTVRNCQEEDADKRKVIWLPDLFNLTLVQRFIEKDGDIENELLDKQISAFEKLATFLDHISDTNKILEEQVDNELLKEGQWATVIGIHVLRKLAVHNVMKIDSGDPDLFLGCPCGCKTPVNIGDNSMGHKEVWHGSVDILLGPVAVAAAKSRIGDEVSEDINSAFELKRGKLEEAQPQLISESITFAFTMQSIVPLVGISKKKFGVFIYDPDEDLLFELTTMPLFISRIEGRQLHITSLVALWMVVNFNEFFTGVKSRHIDFGYKADLKSFLGENKWDIYQHQLRIGGLRHVKSKYTKNHAGKNMGIFKRL